MRYLFSILFLTCVCAFAQAQVNYVRNPSFEEFKICPDDFQQMTYAYYWSSAVDTSSNPLCAPEYINTCNHSTSFASAPSSGYYYQYPHNGNGMAGAELYYDESLPLPYMDIEKSYLQGRLFKSLTASKSYCVKFYVNLAEISNYAHNRIGAYLDNGLIDTTNFCGKTLSSFRPQVFSKSIVSDTLVWTKIEGVFTAIGNEQFISLGNFFINDSTSAVFRPDAWASGQYSYYLFDDVSVIESDLPAYAGEDTWVETGKKVQIGRVGDSTATGLECKWYHKGLLIDSGAIISVHAAPTVGEVDTYVVVQTICGLVKSDTVLVKTFPLGMQHFETDNQFSVYPNPSNGSITITPHAVIPTKEGTQTVKVYDVLGRVVHQSSFVNETSININAADGIYILEVKDTEGNAYRQRIEVRK